MSDTEPQTTTPDNGDPAAQPTTPPNPVPTPPPNPQPDRGSETDWEAEAKKWEKRSKENYEKAQKVDGLQQRVTELESALNDAEHKTGEALTGAYRDAAQQFAGITEDDASLLLTGNDKDTLSKQAARLAEVFAQKTPTPGHVPGEGKTPSTPALNSSALEDSLRSAVGAS